METSIKIELDKMHYYDITTGLLLLLLDGVNVSELYRWKLKLPVCLFVDLERSGC